MDTLATAEELPQEYLDALGASNLKPLWPSLRAVLPPHAPKPNTRPAIWRYADVRPLLLRAGDLTPIERAERRVLVLANPGHGPSSMQATAAIYLGMQLILPGEVAPSHRHTPNAVRIVAEGTRAYTRVDGEDCPMERGDLILTPAGCWHEHGHRGDAPVIWLDVLDLPLMVALETSYVEEAGPSQSLRPDQSRRTFRYPWASMREALVRCAETEPGRTAQLAYVDTRSGGDCLPTLGLSALMLRPGETIALPIRSPAAIFHVVEGSGSAVIASTTLGWSERDTFCVPGYTAAVLKNASRSHAAFLIVGDESPLHKALGVHEVRTRAAGPA